jgi:CO/xanthine dehydrogenase FAD-binding subunit
MSGGYAALKGALDAVRDEVKPIDDIRSTREYRRAMSAVLLERAIRRITEA